MNIQIYFFKRGFDVQKAERYFKERRISYSMVDLHKHTLGRREIQSVAAQVGLKNLIDTTLKEYQTSTVRMLSGEDAIIDALIRSPGLIKTPIVRNQSKATVGYRPDVWDGWTTK